MGVEESKLEGRGRRGGSSDFFFSGGVVRIKTINESENSIMRGTETIRGKKGFLYVFNFFTCTDQPNIFNNSQSTKPIFHVQNSNNEKMKMRRWITGVKICEEREEPLITSAIKTSQGSAFENKNKIIRVQLKRYLNSQKKIP